MEVDSRRWTGSQEHEEWSAIFLMKGEEWDRIRPILIGSLTFSLAGAGISISFIVMNSPLWVKNTSLYITELIFSLTLTVYFINVLLEARNVKKSHDIERKFTQRADYVLTQVKALCLIRNPCSTIIDYAAFLKVHDHKASDWVYTIKHLKKTFDLYSNDFDSSLSDLIIQNNFLFADNPDLLETLDRVKKAKFASGIIPIHLDDLIDKELRNGKLVFCMESIWRAIETHSKTLLEAKYKESSFISSHYTWGISEMLHTSQQELKYWEEIKKEYNPNSIAFSGDD